MTYFCKSKTTMKYTHASALPCVSQWVAIASPICPKLLTKFECTPWGTSLGTPLALEARGRPATGNNGYRRYTMNERGSMRNQRTPAQVSPFSVSLFSYLQIQTELSATYIMVRPPSEARRRKMVLWHADSSVCRLERKRNRKVDTCEKPKPGKKGCSAPLS